MQERSSINNSNKLEPEDTQLQEHKTLGGIIFSLLHIFTRTISDGDELSAIRICKPDLAKDLQFVFLIAH